MGSELKSPSVAPILQQTLIWPAIDRPVVGRDLKEFRYRFQLDLNKMEASFGIPSRRAWYHLTSAEPREEDGLIPEDQEINISAAIFLRFLARNPRYIPLLMQCSAEELRGRLGLSPGGYGLLTGRQEITVRQWTEDREPHKVVCNILCVVEELLNKLQNKMPHDDPEATLADLINCALTEWIARKDSPESRSNGALISPSHPYAMELLNLLTPRTQPIAIGAKVTQELQRSLAAARGQIGGKGSKDGKGVTARERRQATQQVRQRRVAAKALDRMGESFSMDD